MSSSRPPAGALALERRLLNDIAEIQQDPYPNVHLHFDDANVRKACFVLTPEGNAPLHLTIAFGAAYPMNPPTIKMQSRVAHPNVTNGNICASMLNAEGWTSAYTLRGVVIQMLSFFCSDEVEQEDFDGGNVNLAEFRRKDLEKRRLVGRDAETEVAYSCKICGFGPEWMPPKLQEKETAALDGHGSTKHTAVKGKQSKLFTLPDEVVLLLFAQLETRDILALADGVPSIKTMLHSNDFIRIRELQCFCLKKSFMETNLGIGITVLNVTRPVFRSECDLLSSDAFIHHGVRRSIQGVSFDHWLPLPLSRRHWTQVRPHAAASMAVMHSSANMATAEPGHVDVLYHFMTSIVVQFSADEQTGYHRADPRSTLSHASEKSIRSYFSLFHLLICFAVDDPAIVTGANRIIAAFTAGPRTKLHFPDLGPVLVAALISTSGLSEPLTLLVVKEAIVRNVVWALDSKGAGHAELAYLEPDAVSEYRLKTTFAASPTSYRLLMFLALFSRAARPAGSSLAQVRDALFATHGAPPPGTAALMASRIRGIRDVASFPGFLGAMGITGMPSKAEFSSFLRRSIGESERAGYSRVPLSQSQLYLMRRAREERVQKNKEVNVTKEVSMWWNNGNKGTGGVWKGRGSFFPGKGRGG